MKSKLFILTLLFLLGAVACATPAHEPALGEIILTQGFDSHDAWETYEDGDSTLTVNDGSYQIKVADQGYIWGLNDQEHQNVVIEVQTNQLSTLEDNGYGVICRADVSNNGDGYYFLISGDGYYSIRKGEGDDVSELVEWTQNTAVNKGQASNTIRAVCIDDYLALYVNDKFVAEATDAAYTSGYAGLAAAAAEAEGADISFDNLTIWEASITE